MRDIMFREPERRGQSIYLLSPGRFSRMKTSERSPDCSDNPNEMESRVLNSFPDELCINDSSGFMAKFCYNITRKKLFLPLVFFFKQNLTVSDQIHKNNETELCKLSPTTEDSKVLDTCWSVMEK